MFFYLLSRRVLKPVVMTRLLRLVNLALNSRCPKHQREHDLLIARGRPLDRTLLIANPLRYGTRNHESQEAINGVCRLAVTRVPITI
jgi:hypothetical protein